MESSNRVQQGLAEVMARLSKESGMSLTTTYKKNGVDVRAFEEGRSATVRTMLKVLTAAKIRPSRFFEWLGM